MSVGVHHTHLHIPDSALSRHHVDESINALLAKVTINRDYWIPYLAGYNTDWKDKPTVFIDYRLGDKIHYKGKMIEVTRYLLIHECVEKCLMDELGMHYLLAHNLATGAEKSAVEADGHDWADYTYCLDPYINIVARDQPKGKVSPDNLDKTPYVQEKYPKLDLMA